MEVTYGDNISRMARIECTVVAHCGLTAWLANPTINDALRLATSDPMSYCFFKYYNTASSQAFTTDYYDKEPLVVFDG
jgi:hypothetical protein